MSSNQPTTKTSTHQRSTNTVKLKNASQNASLLILATATTAQLSACALAEHNNRIRERQAQQAQVTQPTQRAAGAESQPQDSSNQSQSSSSNTASTNAPQAQSVQVEDVLIDSIQPQPQPQPRPERTTSADRRTPPPVAPESTPETQPRSTPQTDTTPPTDQLEANPHSQQNPQPDPQVLLPDAADSPLNPSITAGPVNEPGTEIHIWTTTSERAQALKQSLEAQAVRDSALTKLGFVFARIPFSQLQQTHRALFPVSPRNRQFLYPSTRWTNAVSAKKVPSRDWQSDNLPTLTAGTPRLLLRNWQTPIPGAAPSITLEIALQIQDPNRSSRDIRTVLAPETRTMLDDGDILAAYVTELEQDQALILMPSHTGPPQQASAADIAAAGFTGAQLNTPVTTIIVIIPRVYQPYSLLPQ